MENRNSDSQRFGTAKRLIPSLAAIAMLAVFLSGCSTTTAPISASQETAMERVELHFSLDQCKPLDDNLFKCPAVDKPVCNPYYNGQLDCVRVGPKGAVYVQTAMD
jgi:hypothetical protein